MSGKSIITIDTGSLFLDAYSSYSASFSPNDAPPPPSPISLVSRGESLPPIPPDISQSKLVPGTRFLIDAFRFAGNYSTSYFLSHFHSDHYAGLTSTWCKGVIFCSQITSRLIIELLKVPPAFLNPLSIGETVLIDGCEVTLVDANHCPGAVQFLFKVPNGEGGPFRRYVHTGDFRFHESMKLNPALSAFIGSDAIFLDTTYCNPKFTFPSQSESIEYIVSTMERIIASKERVLFLVATYNVGKERILIEISRRCNCLIYVDEKKMEVLRILGHGDSVVFTEDMSVSDVHVIGWNLLGEVWPYFRPNFVKMGEMMKERGYTKAVGFVPTGWMYETKRDGFAVRVKDSLEIHLIPYSEHSSYNELREYVRFLRPKRVIPTVGLDVDKLDSKHVVAMQKHFASLVDGTANKHEFLAVYQCKSRMLCEKEENDQSDSSNQGGDSKAEVEEKVEHTQSLVKDADSEDCLKSFKITEKDIEGTIDELRLSLPSWVTKDQMLLLLTFSGNDVVEAVSEFYERETELFEQANCCLAPAFDTIPTNSSVPTSNLLNPTINHDRNIKDVLIFKSLTNKSITTPKKNPVKKRGSAAGSKSKKKGKSSSVSESSGCKQPTITKFFQKLEYESSAEGQLDGAKTDSQSNDLMELSVDDAESYKGELDQFLQIIDFGTPRKSAASLLKKTKGDIDAALELYYSISCDALLKKSISGSASSQIDKLENINKFAENEKKPQKEDVAKSIPSVQDSLVADMPATCLCLPLDKYCAVEHACWKAGQSAPYLHLARTFDLVEKEKGKIKTTGILCNMFRSLLVLSPEDVLPAVYLCTNRIAPEHESKELNIGSGTVTAALEEACGTSRSRLRDMYNDLGDLGDVAQICRQTQSLLLPPRPLSIKGLFSALQKISMETGSGSAIRKKNIIVNLMCSCREKEIKFLVRTLVRNMRIGAMMKTILPSLAQAVIFEHKKGSVESLKEKLQLISTAAVEAYSIVPNLNLLIPALLSNHINFCPSILAIVPGMPIPSMLARIANGIPRVLNSFDGRGFICEFKYDGQRAQIHRLVDGSIRVFSRNMMDVTGKYPDLVEIIEGLCRPNVKTFILDSEVVAIDRNNANRLMPFQLLASRERGGKISSVSLDSIKVDICIFVFDIMFYNGDQLLALPLRERRKYMRNLIFEERPGYLEIAKEITVEADKASFSNEETLSKVQSFLEHACSSSCEGIMVKSLDVDSGYAASKRSDAWLKVKRDYVEGLGDSLDLVPIGAWHGNGRKARWYSPFLMACYNPDAEEFQSVCRIMSGFSDSFYIEMREFFSGEKILPRKPPYYQTDEVPDLWFSSELVWEVRGADFTISPVHHAAIGLVHPSRGISLRFPRYVRTVIDKKPEDCTSAIDIADLFKSQTRKMEVNMSD